MGNRTRKGFRSVQAFRGLSLVWFLIGLMTVDAVRSAEIAPPPKEKEPAAEAEESESDESLNALFDRVAREARGTSLTNQLETDLEKLELPSTLVEHNQALKSTNLTGHAHQGYESARESQYKVLLDAGIQYRKNGLHKMAQNNFSELLKSVQCPEEIKKACLLELALMAEEQDDYGRAIQIYAQYIRTYVQDSTVPEVYLRQGLLYRRMGAPNLALSKFYAVMTSSLNLKKGSFDYYKNLVLQAQTEIADTYFMQGNLPRATDFFSRLLKQESPGLNKAEILYKLIRCQAGQTNHTATVVSSRQFLEKHPHSQLEPEIRFFLANALSEVGQKSQALQQVMLILDGQKAKSASNPTNWVRWQQRTGNQIANQLYQEGDYLSALRIYTALAELSDTPHWQLPILYQIGLVYEKLEQPKKRLSITTASKRARKELATPTSPGLKMVIDMARWRTDYLNWEIKTRTTTQGQTNAKAIIEQPLSRQP